MDFDIHQLILSDLATNIGEAKDESDNRDVVSAIELVTSKVETRALPENEPESVVLEARVFMVRQVTPFCATPMCSCLVAEFQCAMQYWLCGTRCEFVGRAC